MPRVPRVVVPAVAVLAMAGITAQAGAKLPTFRRGALPGAVQRAARTANKRVIVVLKDQARGSLATASDVKARAAAEKRQRAPIIAKIADAGGDVTQQYTTLNG